jgi:hypothetical protein
VCARLQGRLGLPIKAHHENEILVISVEQDVVELSSQDPGRGAATISSSCLPAREARAARQAQL